MNVDDVHREKCIQNFGEPSVLKTLFLCPIPPCQQCSQRTIRVSLSFEEQTNSPVISISCLDHTGGSSGMIHHRCRLPFSPGCGILAIFLALSIQEASAIPFFNVNRQRLAAIAALTQSLTS